MQEALDQKVQYFPTCLGDWDKTLFLSVTQIINKATARYRTNIYRAPAKVSDICEVWGTC